jgi:hypothetical protein
MVTSAAEQIQTQADLPWTDRRASPRIRTVFFMVQVTRDSDVGLFRVRNISDMGMMLVAHSRIEVGERVLIELFEDLAVTGAVVWCKDDCCGVEFDKPIDSAGFLEAHAAAKRDCRRGELRLSVSRRATSYSECGIRAVTITDVSPHGLGLAHNGSIRPGISVKLVLESGVTRSGAVCWSKDGHAGVILAEPFTHVELESASRL